MVTIDADTQFEDGGKMEEATRRIGLAVRDDVMRGTGSSPALSHP